MLVLLLSYVSRSSLYCNIPSDLCSLCLSCYYFYIVLTLYLYCCYVMYTDHHFTVIYLQTCVLCVFLVITSALFYLYTCTVDMLCIQIITLLYYTFRLVQSVFVLLLLLHCFIFILVLLLCCVYRSLLYCNIPSDLCTLCLSCYYFYIVLSLYLYCCYVVYTDHHFTVIYLQICVVCVCLFITSTFFIFILVLLLCFVSRSSLYCNIPLDLCTLRLSCHYFYIVLSLYLYCCYVVYTDHHFTVISLHTCVLCVYLIITSTLRYLYTCTVVMLCIQIITLL